MPKPLLIAGTVLLIVIVVAGLVGWWAWRMFMGPMYRPGDLAASGAALDPPPAGDRPEGTWLVEPGVRLRYEMRGTGRPVLFVHGGPGFPLRGELPPWLDALGGAYAIHAYDQRGCGDSTRPFDRIESSGNPWPAMKRLESGLGLATQVADIERIRRILGEERLLLAGHSFGGFLATLYAIEFPQRVEKLVLLAPADVLRTPGKDGGLFPLVRERLPAPRREQFDRFLASYLDFGPRLFDHDETSLAGLNLELGGYVMAAMEREPPPPPKPNAVPVNGGWMVHAMYLSMGRRHDYRGALATISAPVLVVHGDRDLQPVTAAEQYLERIPSAELLRVAGADHFFDGDHPELTERVRAFLE